MTDCTAVEAEATEEYWNVWGTVTSPAAGIATLRGDNVLSITKYGTKVIIKGISYVIFQAIGTVFVYPIVGGWHYLTDFTTTAATFQTRYHTNLDIAVQLNPTTPLWTLYCPAGYGTTIIDMTAWGTFIPGPEQATVQPVSVESITWFPKKPKVGVI